MGQEILDSREVKIYTTPTKSVSVLIGDTLTNVVSQIGTAKDKRTHNRFRNSNRLINSSAGENELEALYRENFLAGKVVDIIPDDMTREWRNFDGDLTLDQHEDLVKEEDRLGLRNVINQAHKSARLYGTAYILLGINDGKKLSEPLDTDNITVGSFEYLRSFDVTIITAGNRITSDPADSNFGLPESYQLDGGGIIHHTRIVRIEGVKLPNRAFRDNRYVNDSVLKRIDDPLLNLTLTSNIAATLAITASVDVLTVTDLSNILTSNGGESLIKRVLLNQRLESITSTIVIDATETLTQKTQSFTGLPELIDIYQQEVTAGSDVPGVRLLGTSSKGLNATGEGDEKNYYDKLRSDQNSVYKPILDLIDGYMAQGLGFPDDADLSYRFNILFQVTPKEKAETELKVAQRDEIYLKNNVVSEITVAQELLQNKTYTHIDAEVLKEMENEQITKDDINIVASANV